MPFLFQFSEDVQPPYGKVTYIVTKQEDSVGVGVLRLIYDHGKFSRNAHIGMMVMHFCIWDEVKVDLLIKV